MRRGAPFDTCFALSASTCIVSRLCIDTLGLVWLRILAQAANKPLGSLRGSPRRRAPALYGGAPIIAAQGSSWRATTVRPELVHFFNTTQVPASTWQDPSRGIDSSHEMLVK